VAEPEPHRRRELTRGWLPSQPFFVAWRSQCGSMGSRRPARIRLHYQRREEGMLAGLGVVMLRRSGPVDVDRTCVVREGFSQGVRDVPAALACSACRARPGGRPVGSGAATGRLLWACARCQTCRTTTRRWSRTSTARSLSCTTTSATPPNCRAKRRVAAHCRGLGRVGVAAKAFSDVDHGLRGSCSGLYCRG
jgi:hypothetical protein